MVLILLLVMVVFSVALKLKSKSIGSCLIYSFSRKFLKVCDLYVSMFRCVLKIKLLYCVLLILY